MGGLRKCEKCGRFAQAATRRGGWTAGGKRHSEGDWCWGLLSSPAPDAWSHHTHYLSSRLPLLYAHPVSSRLSPPPPHLELPEQARMERGGKVCQVRLRLRRLRTSAHAGTVCYLMHVHVWATRCLLHAHALLACMRPLGTRRCAAQVSSAAPWKVGISC